jgi:tetratricopeptide (TPR) repeat protein
MKHLMRHAERRVSCSALRMEVRRRFDEAIERAQAELGMGNYRGAAELLRPLLRPKAKEKLSLQQERDAVSLLSDCYRFLNDYKAALQHEQRNVELVQRLHGTRSLQHARALKGLCMVHAGLEAFPAARKAISDALIIMDELGLQQHEEYGSLLAELGGLDREQERPLEALVIYEKAKAVLLRFKEGNEYGALLNEMAICHKKLHQWNEAVACHKKAVEHTLNLDGPTHPEYATALSNLALLFANLKQYEEAIPRYEEVLAIQQRVFGEKHERTLQTAKDLAEAQQLAKQSRREIDVGHEYRMCSQCGTVQENMSVCPCFRAWYCDTGCQVLHWATHKPNCNVCLHCNTFMTKVLQCSRCKTAKYCNAECSKAHWSQHKQDCMAPTAQ